MIIKMLLAKNCDLDKMDVTGYFYSEKFDGIRALFSSKERKLYTRNGNIINAPTWFLNGFPDIDLDGELWIGRGMFNKISGITRKKEPISEEWKDVKFLIFDVYNSSNIYEHRVSEYSSIKNLPSWIVPVKVYVVKDNESIKQILKNYESEGAEGLMLRQPGSLYEKKRSSTLLKLKSFKDEEGTVVGYTKGTGRLKDSIGSLIIKDKHGNRIAVGSGMSDDIRNYPPEIGSTIVYKYFEKTEKGLPRFPTFVGIRTDL